MSGALCVVIVVVFLDLCLSCSFLNLTSHQRSLVRSFSFFASRLSLHSLLPCLSLASSSLLLLCSTLFSHPSSSLFFSPLLLIPALSLTLSRPRSHSYSFLSPLHVSSLSSFLSPQLNHLRESISTSTLLFFQPFPFFSFSITFLLLCPVPHFCVFPATNLLSCAYIHDFFCLSLTLTLSFPQAQSCASSLPSSLFFQSQRQFTPCRQSDLSIKSNNTSSSRKSRGCDTLHHST